MATSPGRSATPAVRSAWPPTARTAGGSGPPPIAAGQAGEPALGAGRCRLDLQCSVRTSSPGRPGRSGSRASPISSARRAPSPSAGATARRKRFSSGSKRGSPGARVEARDSPTVARPWCAARRSSSWSPPMVHVGLPARTLRRVAAGGLVERRDPGVASARRRHVVDVRAAVLVAQRLRRQPGSTPRVEVAGDQQRRRVQREPARAPGSAAPAGRRSRRPRARASRGRGRARRAPAIRSQRALHRVRCHPANRYARGRARAEYQVSGTRRHGRARRCNRSAMTRRRAHTRGAGDAARGRVRASATAAALATLFEPGGVLVAGAGPRHAAPAIGRVRRRRCGTASYTYLAEPRQVRPGAATPRWSSPSRRSTSCAAPPTARWRYAIALLDSHHRRRSLPMTRQRRSSQNGRRAGGSTASP